MHIFLTTDGSPKAREAEQLLAKFPFGADPRVTIATVCPAADLHSIGADVTSPITEMLDQCRSEAAQLLLEVAERCKQWTPHVDRLLLDGHPAEELLKAAERLHPDLIAVGSRGLGAVRRMLLGSVSERLAKHAPCSVLVSHLPEGRDSVKSIVITSDGSPASEEAIRRFSDLPLSSDCEVHLMAVVETVHVYGTEMVLEGVGGIEGERQAAAKRLSQAAARFEGKVGEVTTEVHTSSDVAGEILDVAEKRKADVIVLGSQGKSAWERFLLGSVSLRVLHHTPCSVWIERVRA